MSCPEIITGNEFLIRVLGHIDCQAQFIGSYGYQSLSQTDSLASIIIAGFLTLFVALLGVKMLLGHNQEGRDYVYNVLTIGIVLTLAFSWPAYRTVIYDVVLKGPGEIASQAIPQTIHDPNHGFAERLQQIDIQMVILSAAGTGRNTGALIADSDTGNNFSGAVLQDESTFGYARLMYLSSVVGAVGILRLLAALLLALAPLAAGLLFFNGTRGIFSGWLRGLALVMLGSIGITFSMALEMTILEPWLADALNVRNLGYATPSAPIELFSITAGFAAIQLLIIWILAKITFNRGWITFPNMKFNTNPDYQMERQFLMHTDTKGSVQSRAAGISENIDNALRREREAELGHTSQSSQIQYAGANAAQTTRNTSLPQSRFGNSFRRTASRSSAASQQRDRKV